MKTPPPSSGYALLAVFGLALLNACHDPHPADQPDPCRQLVTNPLVHQPFQFLEDTGAPTDIALSGRTITFKAPGEPYTGWEWRIGTDPRAFTTRSVGLYLDSSVSGSIQVRLIARRPQQTACFPNDDGLDTLTRALIVRPLRALPQAPIYGRYLGANLDAPTDTFTVEIVRAPRYPTPTEVWSYVRNLGAGCRSPYFDVHPGWNSVSFSYGGNDYGCLTEAGYGYLTAPDSVRFEYQQSRSTADPTRRARVFVGRRR